MAFRGPQEGRGFPFQPNPFGGAPAGLPQPGMSAAAGPVPGLMPAPPTPSTGMFASGAKSRSFFGEGGVGRGIAGTIGDALLAMNGQQGVYAPAMQQRRVLAQQQKRYDQQAAAEAARLNRPETHFGADGLVQQFDPVTGQVKTINPAAARAQNPTAMQQNYEYLKAVNPALAESFLTNQANPTQWITADNGDGTKSIVPVPRGGMGGGSSIPKPVGAGMPAIGSVMADPRKRNGGARPMGAGGFPVSRPYEGTR